MPSTQTQGTIESLVSKGPRSTFPLVSLRILGGILGVLLFVALCVEPYLQRPKAISI